MNTLSKKMNTLSKKMNTIKTRPYPVTQTRKIVEQYPVTQTRKVVEQWTDRTLTTFEWLVKELSCGPGGTGRCMANRPLFELIKQISQRKNKSKDERKKLTVQLISLTDNFDYKTLKSNMDVHHQPVNHQVISAWNAWIIYLSGGVCDKCAGTDDKILYHGMLQKILNDMPVWEGGRKNKANNSATDKFIRSLSMEYMKKYKSALSSAGDDNVLSGKKKANLKKKKEIEKKKKEIEKKKKKKELEKKKKKIKSKKLKR
jgi:hypothetical protein